MKSAWKNPSSPTIVIGNLKIQYGYNQLIRHIYLQILEYVLETEDTTNYIT